nr:uncharacterized protein LOC119169682 [Rhipicephalus microplus]
MCKQEFKPLSSRLTAHHRAEANTAGRSVISVRCFGKVSSEGSSCAECKSLRKALLTRKSYINCRVHLPVKKTLSSRLTQQKKKTARLQNQACVLKKKLSVMLAKNVAIAEEDFNAKVALLPEKQREATLHIFKASSRKSTKGMIFSNEWVLECLIMKLKSARLYEHLRKEKILVLPSKTTLRKYLKCYRTGFGFSNKIFDVLKQKTCTMDEFLCHGGLIVDELKLSEHLSVNSEGRIDGFVDLGQFTSDKDKHSVCDHGMVIIFVPFVGKWTQILAAFATHGNINGNLLTKIMLEAVILAEKAGLKVDFITSDGATWNRKMWSVMGIKASLTETKCSTLHPVDPTRKLHFLSDFPHLIKCLRNGLLRSDYETPEGRVSLQFVRKALELDGCSVTLQAMHGITGSHTNPNNFEKMRVSLAFQLFGEKVIHGLQLYKSGIEDTCGDITATLKFFKIIHDLVQMMTSRFPAEALRPSSASVEKLRSFQEYLSSWEDHTKGQKGFLSQSTAAGLRVTVSSVLSLLQYLTEKLGYRYC